MGSTGIFATILLLTGYSLAQNTLTYRVCTDPSKTNNCQGVELSGSRVSCVIAETSIDCALRIAAGEADFSVFSEEEVFLLAQQQPDSHTVISSVRHQTKLQDAFAFESVAVVRSTHSGGLQGLTGTGFCHPGYNYRDHRWSPRVLKYFEDTVAQTSRNCDPAARTPAASQAGALSKFFGSACRPGTWSDDPADDALLKSRHPTLCNLCNNRNCADGYSSGSGGISVGTVNSHTMAIGCVADGAGNVTYVAWQHVREFYQGRADVSSFSLLCEDGTLRMLTADVLLNSTAPCSWVRQPWPAVVAARNIASSLQGDLRLWMPSGRATDPGWTNSLDAILFSGDPSVRLVYNDSLPSPTDYVTPGRGSLTALENSALAGCHRIQRWCTVSAGETLKCNWIRRAAISLGVEPVVECVQFDNEIACLNNIQMDRADFISLDSNYGYLARNRYRLSTVLYHQTQRAHSSRVVALLKTSSTDGIAENNNTITRFENLRGKTACFPEYGGLAWVSFVRAAHERQVISEAECNYAAAVSDFFGAACAPGAHLSSHTTSVTPATLCGACRQNTNFPPPVTTTTQAPGTDVVAPVAPADLTCNADFSNLFYSTNGSLACIASAHTDVAFIEAQYLGSFFTAQGLNQNNFRVLCRNNTLAAYTGVNVDDNCLLAYTVDGELLARRDWDRTVALKSLFYTLDELFGYSSGVQLVNLKIFSPFNRVSNLLFKDSVIGLTDSNSTMEQARNYEDLFRHLDACSAATTTTTPMPTPASAARLLMPLLTLALAPLFARIMV